jgi:hypothetical protein
MNDNKDRPIDIILTLVVFAFIGVLLAWRG